MIGLKRGLLGVPWLFLRMILVTLAGGWTEMMSVPPI
jgi:hypothetical protein